MENICFSFILLLLFIIVPAGVIMWLYACLKGRPTEMILYILVDCYRVFWCNLETNRNCANETWERKKVRWIECMANSLHLNNFVATTRTHHTCAAGSILQNESMNGVLFDTIWWKMKIPCENTQRSVDTKIKKQIRHCQAISVSREHFLFAFYRFSIFLWFWRWT